MTLYGHRVGNDDYRQAGNLFRLLSEDEQKRLCENIAGDMKDVSRPVQLRQLKHFYAADLAYGKGVAELLGLSEEL